VIDNLAGVQSVTINGAAATDAGGSLWEGMVRGITAAGTTVEVIAVDKSTSANTDKATYTFYYDSTLSDVTPPVISAQTDPPKGSVVPALPFTMKVQVTDNLSGVASVKLNGLDAVKAGGYWEAEITTLALGPNKIYIEATDNQNNTAYDSANYTYDPPIAPVTLLSPSSPTASSLTLTWNASALIDFDRYQVYYRTQAPVAGYGTLDTVILSATDTVRTVKGLLENTRYYFQILVFDMFWDTVWSNTVNATTLNATPGAVDLYSPVNVTESSMDLIWSKSTISDFLNYKVFSSTSGAIDSSGTPDTVIQNMNDTTFTLSSLAEKWTPPRPMSRPPT
jgi:hypothetical protein